MGATKAEIQQVNIVSTTIPAGATHFLAYSGNSFGEMVSPLSVPIQDLFVWNLLMCAESEEDAGSLAGVA